MVYKYKYNDFIRDNKLNIEFSFLVQRVAIFEQNLCQLVKELKEFTFLIIYGEIHNEKIEAYRSMVQVRFSHIEDNFHKSNYLTAFLSLFVFNVKNCKLLVFNNEMLTSLSQQYFVIR